MFFNDSLWIIDLFCTTTHSIMKKKTNSTMQNMSVLNLLHFMYPHTIFFILAYIVIVETFQTPIFSLNTTITSSQSVGVFLFQSAYFIFLATITCYSYYGVQKLNRPQALIKLNQQFFKIFLFLDVFLIILYYQVAPRFFF